jgi:hypothetical protein
MEVIKISGKHCQSISVSVELRKYNVESLIKMVLSFRYQFKCLFTRFSTYDER